MLLYTVYISEGLQAVHVERQKVDNNYYTIFIVMESNCTCTYMHTHAIQ